MYLFLNKRLIIPIGGNPRHIYSWVLQDNVLIVESLLFIQRTLQNFQFHSSFVTLPKNFLTISVIFFETHSKRNKHMSIKKKKQNTYFMCFDLYSSTWKAQPFHLYSMRLKCFLIWLYTTMGTLHNHSIGFNWLLKLLVRILKCILVIKMTRQRKEIANMPIS